ncbi:MAG: hypothetical protein IPK66_17660, partial [Rhodospirillales bacterium]|nr:hypothetical protein [Rhodospirillales bacterium]
MDGRGVTIGHDAVGNAIVTGDNNLTVVLIGVDRIPDELQRALQERRLRPVDLPGAVPLPALTLLIAFAGTDRTHWQITARRTGAEPVVRSLPVPWLEDRAFAPALDSFRRSSRVPARSSEEAAILDAAAHRLGAALAAVLSVEEAAFLIEAALGDPPPPLLVIESDDDAVLALPWGLLRLRDRFAVRAGRLDVARSVPGDQQPALSPPSAPVSLLVNVSAPEGSGLDYERESFFIIRALHEHIGVVVNEMGELDD